MAFDEDRRAVWNALRERDAKEGDGDGDGGRPHLDVERSNAATLAERS